MKKLHKEKDKNQKKSKTRKIVFVTSTALGVVGLAVFLAKKYLPQKFVYHVEGAPGCMIETTEEMAEIYNRVEAQIAKAVSEKQDDSESTIENPMSIPGVDPTDVPIWRNISEMVSSHFAEDDVFRSSPHRLVRS